MKKLLMLSYPFPPNASAGAVRSERFARYLPQFGWAVDVVTIKPRKDMFEDTEQLNTLGNDVTVHFTKTFDPWLWLKDKRLGHFAVRAIRSLLMRLFSFPDHMFLWVPFAVQKGLEICKREKIAAIYSTSPPHSTHLAAQILSALTNKPWIADFRDPWTLNANRDEGLIKQGLLKIERALEKGVLRKASVVLANTTANRKNLIAAFPFLAGRKVIHLPNGWEEFPRDCYKVQKTSGPFTIVHAGTFYPRFKPYTLLYAIAAWRNGQTATHVPTLQAGDIKIILLGARDEETVRVVQDLNIGDFVEFRPWVALNEARRLMCQSDLLWASLGTGKESSTYVPSKLFEYMAAKKPIIGFFPEGMATSLIRDTGSGVVFTAEDIHAVVEFLGGFVLKDNREATPTFYKPMKKAIAECHILNIASKLAALLDETLDIFVSKT